MVQLLKRSFAALAAILAGAVAFAQVTTSSLAGHISDETGEPLAGAAVVAVHTPSGTQYATVANGNGQYTINGMRVGGPYTVTITFLGYQTVQYTDVTLQLAETYNLNARVNPDNEQLQSAVVLASPSSKFAGEKTGAATNINNSQMGIMPTVSRSITDIAKISPYGGNGMSFSGADGRNVNFTVDGANFNNNFGLSSSLPGGGSPISIDAIEEMQVVISPFDVRQTNFIGGGVNAITKSGTNTLRGSAYVYHQNENMHGNRVYDEELSARERDRKTTYGFTIGGPVIKNKLFFFLNGEYIKKPTVVNRWRASEDGVMNIDKYISRTTTADLEAVKNKLASLGYDTGSYTDFPADENNKKILARIDWNITNAHHLAVRYNFTDNVYWNSPNASSSDAATRPNYARMSQYAMSFANSMYSMHNKVSTWSVDLNSRLSDNLSNQFLATYSHIADERGSNSSKFPFIDILNNRYDEDGKISEVLPYISAGYELFTWGNSVTNNTITIKDDVTYYAGDHKITAGASYEYQMALNRYMREGTGYYRYSSLQDFLNDAAPETVSLTYGYDGETFPASKVRFSQIGFYVQDDWNISNRFKVNYGVRFDTLVFNEEDVKENVQISQIDFGGKSLNTGLWPKTRLMTSPRFGFTWDVLGDKSLKVRGGTGLFVGRLPLVFFTNMPSNSNMLQNVATITTTYKDGVGTPNPLLSNFAGPMITDTEALMNKLNSLDPEKFPTATPTEKGAKASTVNGVDPGFKMPKVWKTSFGIDYIVPVSFPLSFTGEFTFTKTIDGTTMKNWNIKDNSGWATLNGPDNRHVYPKGAYTYTGTNAYVLSNTNEGYGWMSVFSVNAEPVRGLRMSASYTHTVNKELTGLPGSNAASTMEYTPAIEGANFLNLHTSQYVNPDRIIASASYSDKGNNHYSVFYQAMRYGGYSFIYSNDLNGDGKAYDAMYIPNDADELRFTSEADKEAFWSFLEQDKYLSSHKGQYAEAYDLATPFHHVVDFRYMHDFKINIGNRENILQISLDVQNVANLFNSKWGVSKRLYTNNNYATPLRVDHIDYDGVPVFATNVYAGTSTWQPAKTYGNCWYMQIGAKLMF